MPDAHGEPLVVYQILEESTAQRGLTRLVGREHELGLLCERWTQVKDGLGQVVLLSGEAGIGKSRLVQALKEHLAGEVYTRVECRCSPYYQNTTLYPVVTHVQRLLRWHRGETAEEKLRKLEETLLPYGLALTEAVPLLATLLALPLPDHYVPLTLMPQHQKQKTLEILLAWLLAEVERQPMCFIVEDLHWADASTLEWLSLLIEQVPTTRLLLLLVFRPDFRPPWAPRSYLTPLSLGRLSHRQVETMTERITERILGGTPLPAEVLRHVIAATDGVPLFIEELTKMILESGLVKEREGQDALRRPLPALAIPATLYESLMARLDQWEAAKPVAQLGAVVGCEFPSEMLQAVWPGEEDTLQQGLAQLVNAELLYRRGGLHQALYVFKHALIQEAAYQSLLRSTRQQYHQQIARVLEARFPDVCETQPELLAQHYTQAGLTEQAVGYWQRAGQCALQRSAYVEAMTHLTRGLELLKLLPETGERLRQELDMQMSLGAALRVTKGQGAPEVERLYIRGRALCERVGEPPQLFRVLWGLWTVYQARGEYQTMRALGQQLLSLAQRLHDAGLLLEAYHVLWSSLFFDGEIAAARPSLEQGLQLSELQRHCTHITLYSGHDSGVCCRMIAAQSLWLLGYPDQAVASSQAALALAQQMAHPYSLDFVLRWAAVLHHLRREAPLTQARAEAAMTIATEQGFPLRLAQAMPLRGWALAARGYGEEGRAQIEQGLATYQAAGVTASRPYYLALLAEAAAQVGQPTAGLEALAEALTILAKSTVRWWEAELYRLRGELLLQRSVAQPGEAEACFQQSLAVARRQQAKSLELRATMSLSRLWQHQGKRRVAYDLLAPIYGWFTEGFDTADLQEAKALLEVLA